MFTVATLIEALKKQRPEAQIRNLYVQQGEEGLELSGTDDKGRPFRLLIRSAAKPKKPG